MCTAINAITMALMHAGVAMSDMIVACSAGTTTLATKYANRLLDHIKPYICVLCFLGVINGDVCVDLTQVGL
jgi:hypothetical protein